MATQQSLSKQVISSTSAHGFFKTLPREVRDAIYELLSQKFWRKPLNDQDFSPFMEKRVQLVALRLINRQFRDEYDERFLKNKHIGELVVNDIGFPRPATLPFPQFAFNTTNMTLNLHVCRCEYHLPTGHARGDRPTRLREHKEWIDRFARDLPHLRSMRVILIIPYLRCMDDTLRALELMSEMSKVAKVELRPSPFVYPNFDGKDVPTLATWIKQQGLIEDQEVIRKFHEMGPFQEWDACSACGKQRGTCWCAEYGLA